jgi:hypothetical protein
MIGNDIIDLKIYAQNAFKSLLRYSYLVLLIHFTVKKLKSSYCEKEIVFVRV